MAVSFSHPQPGLPPRLQPGPGNIHPVRSPGVHAPAPPPAGLAYEHYRPHLSPRPPRGYAPPRLGTKFFTDAYSLLYLLNICPFLTHWMNLFLWFFHHTFWPEVQPDS